MNYSKIGLWASASFLFSTSLFDLIICPHSKVEESFHLQATHDLYYFGIGQAVQYQYSRIWNTNMSSELQYDHLQFPGVVPRTFTGSLILSFLCRILLFPCSVLNVDVNPHFVQFLARFCLLSLNLWGWLRLALTVDRISLVSPMLQKKKSAMTEGAWLLLITACQFHIPFYSSRMLPNSFALAIVLHSYSCWLEKKVSAAAALIVFGASVFRCDLLLLLGTMGSSWLFHRELSVVQALRIGITTWVISLAITIPLDSLMWQRPVWPEGEVFYFNVILGKSNEWGLSPWHWYFTTALPKAMLLTIFLFPLSIFRIVENLVLMETKWSQLKGAKGKKSLYTNGVWVDRRWLRYVVPVLGFIVLYSFLGHKEIRFIFPALPLLNLGAAIGMSKLTQMAFPPRLQQKDKEYFVPWIGRVCFLCGLITIGLTLVGSLIFVMVSKENYDGGDALRRLSSRVRKVVATSEESALEELMPHVHIDVAAAMSGVSLFGQRAAQATTPQIEWSFSKDGYEEGNSALGKGSEYEQYTHLLSEDKDIVLTTKFSIIYAHQGNPRLDIRNCRIVTEDTIFVLEKNGWGV